MDKKQYFEKYDWLITKTQSILEHYSCPELCNANCCKNYNINFTKKEYEKIFEKGSTEITDILKSNAVDSPRSEFYKMLPAAVCPLLIDSKCRIYEYRPESCRKFPFATSQDTESGHVLLLFLCPMSVNIIRDYAQWYNSVNSMDDQLKNIYEQYKNIEGRRDGYIILDENTLDLFIAFLEGTGSCKS